MKQLFATLSVIVLCIACSDQLPFTEYEKRVPENILLVEHELDTTLLYSDDIFVRDSLLINVNSQNRNGLFDIFSKNDFKYLGTCGLIGRGPDEFSFLNTNCTRIGYDGLAVTEVNSYCIADFLKVGGKMQVTKSGRTKLPASCPAANSLLVLSDSASVIYFENDNYVEFYLHDRQGNLIHPISYYPKSLLSSKMSSSECSSIFLNELVSSASKRRFAAIYSQLPMIRIFDYDGTCISTALLDTRKEQIFVAKQGRVVTSASIQYYLAAAANDRYICALYLGEHPERMRNTTMEDARMEIHIWNWDGEPVATYIPDKLITDIALDDNDTLYAISPLDDRHIFTYKIDVR